MIVQDVQERSRSGKVENVMNIDIISIGLIVQTHVETNMPITDPKKLVKALVSSILVVGVVEP